MKQKSVKWWRYFFLLCLMGISVCMYASGGKRAVKAPKGYKMKLQVYGEKYFRKNQYLT